MAKKDEKTTLKASILQIHTPTEQGWAVFSPLSAVDTRATAAKSVGNRMVP